MHEIHIGGRAIGPDHAPYVVAELSANHNGSLARALATVRAAAAAGVDAIKLQTYTPATITLDSDRPEFMIPGGPWQGRRLWDLYEEAHTPWEWHADLFAEARGLGLQIFSSPFDKTAIELLESLDAPAYKIASPELIDDALLQAVAATGKTVIISTGMATLEEILHAVGVLRRAGARELLVLKCTSAYPAPDDAMNLAAIPALAQATACAVGLSDHSLGTVAAVVAVTLGACFIEKHFTLDRADGGVDAAFSLEPAELTQLATDVRRAALMRGVPEFGAGEAEAGNVSFRRSLFVVADVAAGEMFTADNVRSIRPGNGLHPSHFDLVVGRRATSAVARGTPLEWQHVTQ